MMFFIQLIVIVAVVGMLVWAVEKLVPMPQYFKTAIYVIAVIGLAFFILNAFNLLQGFPNLKYK
jgi:hypothetical protein